MTSSRPARSGRHGLVCAALTFLTFVLVSSMFALQAPAASSVSAKYRLRTVDVPGAGRYLAAWDRCAGPIRWKINVVGVVGAKEKKAATRETQAALARVGSAVGLSFTYTGTTSYIPRPGGQQPETLVVAFVRPAQTSYRLTGSTAGYGGSYVTWSKASSTAPWYVRSTSGFVVIDQPQTRSWRRSVTNGVTRPNLLAHEIGHVVGLDHVADRHQLMNPTLTSTTPARFGPGDKRGLQALRAASAALCTHR